MSFTFPMANPSYAASKKHLPVLWAISSAMVLFCASAFAQGPIQVVPGTPRVDQPSQGGGGLGIGINIDLGSVFNAIKNAPVKN